MTARDISVLVADTAALRGACIKLRFEVFVDEQGISADEEIDGLDEESTHVLVLVDGEPAGTARLRIVGETAKIQRVCVLNKYRGAGIGAAAIRFILDHVRDNQMATSAALGSQVSAIEFYRKLGFEAYGEEYMDAGIPHRDMRLTF